MDAIFECIFKGLFGFLPVLCECLCQNLGPLLGSLAECMFKCVSVGCVPLMELVCTCWCQSGRFLYLGPSKNFDGCFYIFLGLLLGSIVIGTLALGIYALSEYIQDFNPNVAAGVACAILNEQVIGRSFSVLPMMFGRSKGLNVVALPANSTVAPITVVNRCFNNNRGSARFFVNGKYAAYTKIDRKLYSCTGNVTHQFQYDDVLRVLNADGLLLALTDKVPAVGTTTVFKDTSNRAVAAFTPSAQGSGLDIRILVSNSAAAAPLVLLAAAAFAEFTTSGYDECNGFVLAGGIIDLVLLSILLVFCIYMIIQWRRKRHQMPAKRFYEPEVVVEPPPLPPPKFVSTAFVIAHDPSTATFSQPPSLPAHAVDYMKFPQPSSTTDNEKIGLLFQEDEDCTKCDEVVQKPVFSPSAPAAASTMAAESLPSGTPLHLDLREALKPVGYTRLKRYLILHNVNVGLTLLKEELITLAVIYRGQIDFSPLVAEVANVFTQPPQ
jgi:hypothetical protein